MSTQEIWTKVDDYVAVLAPEDEHLVAARRRTSDAGMPDIAVSAPRWRGRRSTRPGLVVASRSWSATH